MKLLTIINKIDFYLNKENDRELMEWFQINITKEPYNLDLAYWYLEALANFHHDAEYNQREPLVQNLCSEVIRGKVKREKVDVAKAYAYRGEMKKYKLDRIVDFDKARSILKKMDQKDKEVRFITKFINEIYDLHIRRMFEFYTTKADMFIL